MSDTTTTLALRLDANGFVIPANQIVGATEAIGKSAAGVERRIRTFGTNAAFAVSSFASSAAKDFTSVLRSASALAFGFGTTIGVVALSVSAIADAFQTARQESKAEMDKMLSDLTSFEREFGKKARLIRIATLEARIEQLNADIARPATEEATPLARFGKQFREGIGRLFGDRFAPADPRMAQVRELEERAAALRLLDVEAGRAKAFEDWAQGNADAMKDFNNEMDRADRHADFVRSMEEKAAADDVARARSAERFNQQRTDERQSAVDYIQGLKGDAKMFGQISAVGQGARLAGPFGNAFAGFGMGLVAGNPWMAATAGAFGLVDAIIGMGESSKRAREEFRQWQLQFDSFMDRARVEAGHLSETEAGINQLQRDFAEQRRVLQGQLFLADTGLLKGPPGAREDIQRQLDELNRLEQELTEKRRREADEMERLNTAYRNAPTGFFVEKYLRDAGAVVNWERAARPGDHGWSQSGSTSQNVFVFREGSIVLRGSGNGQEMLTSFVSALRQQASATVGAGAPLSSALDLM